MPTIDSNGIQWLLATGEQDVIPQSREDPNDYRWSQNYANAISGYEATVICTFDGVAAGGHMALKHWGPNHCGSCANEESGSCCCWYDTGIRANGDVQTQIERSHPDNHDWTCTECTMTNIGQGMDGNIIGLKWMVYPLIANGSAANGGVRIKMYKSTSALVGGVPANNWVLVYDIIDNATRDILDKSAWTLSGRPSYQAPQEQEIEMRISDTDTADTYAGGLHVRFFRPSDIYGGGQGCPVGTHYDTTTGTCVSDSTSCGAGQHWDYVQGKCVDNSVPPPPPPNVSQTDIKLVLSGGNTNTNPKLSLGGHQSTHEFLGTEAHQILERVERSEMQSGMTDYHMLYITNSNALKTYNNIRIFIYHNTINPFDQILIGLAAAGKNNEEAALAFDTDTPPNVTFTAAEDTIEGLYIPSLGPNERYGLWIKRTVNQGSAEHHGNIAKIAVDFTPSSIPSDPNVPPPPPPPVQCLEGQHWDYTLNECVDNSIPPPPPDPTEVNFSVVVVSDMLCNNDFDDIYANIKARNPDQIFCAGDFMKDGSCMIDTVQDTKGKWIITLGNHDVESSSKENDVREFGEFPATNYYTATFNNVAVLVFDFNGNTTSGTQATWMQSELTRFSTNPAIEWIFVLSHGPFYSTESDHANEVDMREFWHPKFDAAKVDIMFNGHNHTKEVTSLVRYNETDSDNPIPTQTGGTYSYNRGTLNHGMLFIQAGSGGDSSDNAGDVQDWMEFTSEEKGYVLLDFSEEGKRLTIKHMDMNENILYTANITHRL